MKKILFTALILAGSLSLHAEDYPYLIFETSGGTLTSVSVSSLSLSVSSGNLVVTNSEGSQSFTLSSLSKMYFSTTDPTGINSAKATADEEVEIITASGTILGKYANLRQALPKLKNGVYIVKAKSSTYKIAVK